MSKNNKPNSILSYENGVLLLAEAGEYSYQVLNSGKVKFQLDNAKSAFISVAEFSSLTAINLVDGASIDIPGWYLNGKTFSFSGAGSLNLTGISIPEASANGPVEASVDLSKVNFGGTLDTVNGNKADYFTVMWDLLDDTYVSGGNYYDTTTNEAFVRLGVEYVNYLEAGGEPLVDFTAKFAVDNGDADTIPQRSQSMHDNLLGNLGGAAVEDRNFPEALEAELLALIPDDYQNRPTFDGNQASLGGAKHDAVRAFDYDKGWDRPDYVDAYYGAVDLVASIDTNNDNVDDSMYYGTGNSNTAFSVLRHEGAGVELALKAKEYGPNGGDTLGTPIFDANGTAHYQVGTGASPDHSGRADWSIDYSATVLASGLNDTFAFKLFIDVDETAGESLVEYPVTLSNGLTQGSVNYGFLHIRELIDIDEAVAGVQPYAYGSGEFSIELRTYDGEGDVLLTNKMIVHVGDLI